ncbi:MAG: nuclear transport factor 2 family protein [Alphaproteobacteria bacterium]|nr:nuclear transport factor 2 family protein [Alphaproteobacteria bacterium]
MRITRRHLAAAGALTLAVASPPARAESGDELAVRKAIEDLTKAMVAGDKAALEGLVSDSLSYGHSGGKVENKAQFVDAIASKRTVFKSISLSDPTIAVVANNAIARHTFSAEVEANGERSSPKIGVLQVWVKDGGNWKLLARQAFKI